MNAKVSILATSAAATAGAYLLVCPAYAAGPERATVELIPGVAFYGDGAVEKAEAPAGAGLATFWRPVLFGPKDEPLGGRMDCRASAWREPFSPTHFDLAAVFAAEEPRLSRDGWREMDRAEEKGAVARSLEVVGRRSKPVRYVVQTYIAVRSGDELVNVRRNCTLIRSAAWLRPDYREVVARYTGIALDLPPPATEDPLDTPSLERLTDLDA